MEGEVPNFSGETGGGLAPLRGSQAVCTCEKELSRVLDESLELWPWQRVRYEPRTLADPFKAAEGSVEGLGRTQEIFSQAERLSGETIDFLRETISSSSPIKPSFRSIPPRRSTSVECFPWSEGL